MKTIQDLKKINTFVDHTVLKESATESDVRALCSEALEYRFAAVCVRPGFVALASELLKGSDVEIATVIGFPEGTHSTSQKIEETNKTVKAGATEFDMVQNYHELKKKNYSYVFNDIQAIVEAARPHPVKVILETSELSRDEIIASCVLSVAAGAAFVKTSTGFSSEGATLENVRLMRETVGKSLGVKASGGVRDLAAAQAMIEAGANRIGTSSGVKITKDSQINEK